MEYLKSYLENQMKQKCNFSYARTTVNDYRIKVIYMNEDREKVLEVRGELFNNTFVIDFLKTYTQFRGQGICKQYLTNLIQIQTINIGIFQVVSSTLNHILAGLDFKPANFTESYQLERETVNTGCSYYVKDFGDYIYTTIKGGE